MTALLFIAIIVIVIFLFVLNDKINKLQWENSQLKRQIDQLWGLIRRQNTANQPVTYDQSNVWPQPPSPVYPPPTYTPPPAYSPPPAYTSPSPYVQAHSVNREPVYPPVVTPQPQPTAYTVPVTVPQGRAYVPSHPQMASQPAVASSTAADTPSHMENWFGRNVLGVAASILFFVGLIVFAVWIYNDIPEWVKIVLMYGISGAVTAAGIVLTTRRRNNFTLILTGCGCGLLFISVLLTYVYFGRLNDIATFSLLLAWLAAALVLAKLLHSTLISLVAHIGMGVSICFAYAAGLQDDKLLMLLIYQAASILVIVVGNILCCRRTYRFGLFLSMVMTLTAGVFMTARFMGDAPLAAGAFPLSGLPAWSVAVSFFGQFLCVSFLSYLVAVSTTRLENADARVWIHLANKALWLAALCLHVLPVVYRLTYAYSGETAYPSVLSAAIMASVGIALLLLHALLSVFMSTRLGFDGRLETISVLLAGASSAILLFLVWISGLLNHTPAPHLPLFLLPAGLLLLAGFFAKNRAYSLAANILLGMEWVLMAFSGFHELTRLGTVALPLLYMALYAGVVWLQWIRKPTDARQKLFLPFRLFIYLFLQITTLIILAGSGYLYWHVSLLLSLIALNIVLRFLKFDRGESRLLTQCMRIAEVLLLTASALMLAFMPKNNALDTTIYAALAVIAAIYAFHHAPSILLSARSHCEAQPHGNQGEQVYLGFKFTLLSLAVMQGFTSWFANGYLITLAALATMLPCLAAGYACKADGLVKYGLIAAMPCAVKLLFLDVPFGDSLSRLIALLTGAFLFFLIHLLYDKLDAKISVALTIIIRIMQHAFLAAGAIVIAFSPSAGPWGTVLHILLTILSFIWAFWWTPKTLGHTGRQEAVLEGVKLTVLVLATVHGFTDWFANAYVLSLICMLTSLICIIAGFIRRTGSLRLYGLVLTMICVLKLVTWDVAGLETLLRILSLISGGVICFAISAIYSYSVKHLSSHDQKADQNTGWSPPVNNRDFIE